MSNKQIYESNYQCVRCGKVHTLEFDEQEMSALIARDLGADIHIQDALPNKTPAERELVLSGICGECYDKMFKGMEVKENENEG